MRNQIKYYSTITPIESTFYYKAIHSDGRQKARTVTGNWFDDRKDCFEWTRVTAREATNNGKLKPNFD